MITKIDHLVITTSNMEKCIAFYEMLGFHAQDAGGRWELFAGDFKINVHHLHHELEPKAANVQIGSADLCFEINGSLETYKKFLMDKEIKIEEVIVHRYGVKGKMSSLYLRDPDGNLIELCSYN